jgi:hypothetical protein
MIQPRSNGVHSDGADGLVAIAASLPSARLQGGPLSRASDSNRRLTEKTMQALENQRLDFRVSPGTAMGDALRRYWTPVCMSADVADPDCDPIRAWVLGQSFVVFHDTAGRVGVLDEA